MEPQSWPPLRSKANHSHTCQNSNSVSIQAGKEMKWLELKCSLASFLTWAIRVTLFNAHLDTYVSGVE